MDRSNVTGITIPSMNILKMSQSRFTFVYCRQDVY